ncbi:MAG: hypothetical protein ACC631_11525, partial [Halocynthiibacter sp.]
PVDEVVADAGGMGLKVFVCDEAAFQDVKSLLDTMATGKIAEGPLEFCISLPHNGKEIVIDSGRKFPLTPKIKGAIKSLSSVVLVEDI